MKIKKITQLSMVVLCLLLVGALAVGCKKVDTTTSSTRTVTATVTVGDITESITGTGNLAYANVEKLAFEMAGTVEEVLVGAGETVKKDQELARLDTSTWEEQIGNLEKAVTTAQRTLQTKERLLVTSQRQVTAKELAVRSTELDLQTTQNSLDNISDVKAAKDAVDLAQLNLKVAQSSLAAAGDNAAAIKYYLGDSIPPANPGGYIGFLQQVLTQAQKNYQDVSAGINVSSDVALQIAKAQLQIEQSQRSLEDAKLAVEDAKTAVNDAELNVEDAKQAVQDAQAALDEAKLLNPLITAPFDGYITKVNVVGGDDVQRGTIALQIADPTVFEANIMVTENDIFSVAVGGKATVSLDALSDLTYPAEITEIAPTASVSQGVVNYSVTVKLTSLRPVTAMQIVPGQQPDMSAVAQSMGMTEEQLQAAIKERMQSGIRPGGMSGTTLPTDIPAGGFFQRNPAGQSATGTTGTTGTAIIGNTTTTTTETVTLKDGLSATVEIISSQVTGVLTVPSKAISRKSGDYTVQVVTGETTETRTVKIGMTDGTTTEITEGLSEGETVTYTVSSSSSSNSSTGRNQMVPGGAFEIRGGF